MVEDVNGVSGSEALEEDPRGVDDPNSPFNVRNPALWPGAVLLADEIRYYCTEVDESRKMIEPFSPSQLRPAGYQLRLGKDVRVDGKTMQLYDEDDFPLPPHGVAILSTEETLRIPRFMIARWGLRVRRNYQGLLWTGGLAVDPGWVGRLNCPIYNLSDKQITLRHEDAYFTIDFVRTTALTDEYRGMRYQEGMSKTWFDLGPRSIEELDKSNLRSAPLGTEERLRDVRNEVAKGREDARQELQQLRNTAFTVMAVMFTAIGAVVAAIAAIAANPVLPEDGKLLSGWPFTAIIASSASIVISVYLLGAHIFRSAKRSPSSSTKENAPKNGKV